MSDVEGWRSKQDAETLAAIDELRAIVVEAGPELVEGIKWNAPSFALNGEDRVTLGVERKGGVRVVLHRGATKAADDFRFVDREGLADWPSPDRGVMKFADAQAVERQKGNLTALIARWIDATT